MTTANPNGIDARGHAASLGRLGPRHLDQAHGLSQALNWPYRREDWAFALNLGTGFAIEREGTLIGTALWWPYGAAFGSVGMIIVSSDAQRQGIGARLTAALLADAAGRDLILNSTREGEPLYARLGFRPYGAITQHQAHLQAPPPRDPAVPIRAARPEDAAELVALDEAGSGMPRGRLLDAILPMAKTMVVERDGRIAGYGCVRRWGRGVVIGPVIARDQTDARALIAALAADQVSQFVRIDVTADSGLRDWLADIGLPVVGDALCMALGEPPRAAPGAALMALSNQSLG